MYKEENIKESLMGIEQKADDSVGCAEYDLYFPASDKALADATSFIEQHLKKAGMSAKFIMRISLVLEEIFINIAHYAYPNMEGTVCIGFTDYKDSIRIRFTDSGVPFDPLKKDDPDITASAEERGIGGLGIYLVKQLMDEVLYEYVNGKNVLTMTKKKEENK